MANEEMSAFDRDKKEKQSLVVENIVSHCNVDSSIEDLRTIGSALEDGGDNKLEIINLAGGYTNYTYKVFLSSNPSTALFAKLCFPRAFWNPDPDCVYDVQRTANEYIMMEKFGALAPGCVATPYLLIDIDEMKLLVTQWAHQTDEQMANQFIDGVADHRVAQKLANSIAALHCSSVDPDFNTDARECMISVFPEIRDELMGFLEPRKDKENRASQLTKSFGKDLCTRICDNLTSNYRAKECPSHADLHVFNLLVEKKPDVCQLEEFGPNGSFVVCDWEMTMYGPLGIDMGRLYLIPVACMIAHTIGGNHDVSTGFFRFMSVYWEEYASSMTRMGKSDLFLRQSYRNAMAWLGWKLFAISVFEWFIPFLPLDGDESIVALKESLGVFGLTLMRWGFAGYEDGLSVTEFESRLQNTITDELTKIRDSQVKLPRSRRRSSILRETGRRISDASLHFYSVKNINDESQSKL